KTDVELNIATFDPIYTDAELELGKSGGIAPRLREARHKAGADRVGRLCEHDWHGMGRLLQRRHDRGARGQNDIRYERHHFRRIGANSHNVGAGIPDTDLYVLAVDPSQLLQALPA